MTTALPGLRRVEQVMGLPILIDLRDEHADRESLDRAFDEFREVDARFSTYRDESEISRINRGELSIAEAHADVREILARCDELRATTRGFFDVHAASAEFIDPSGLVKGWSVDRVVAMLEQDGLRDFAVSAGGDVVVRGRAVPDTGWRVGIQHPEISDKLARVVLAHDLAIATFFCKPYAPWQKGGVENAIGRMRRFIPRKTDLATLSSHRFRRLIAVYNHPPRKCLDFKTPAEVFS